MADQNINPVQTRPDYQQEILSIIEHSSSPLALSEALEDFHAYDVAQTLQDLKSEQKQTLLALLDEDHLAEILDYLETEEIQEILPLFEPKKMVRVFNLMDTEVLSDLFEAMDEGQRKLIEDQLLPSVREALRKINAYNDEQIGSRITTNYISVPKTATVPEAMRMLTYQANKHDNINTIYVTDDNGAYYGAIELKDLIIARKDDPLESIISTSYPYFFGKETIEKVIEDLKDYNEDSIPVVNDKGIIQGILTAQDLLDVLDDELSEDYARLAGLTGEEDLDENLAKSLRKRLPWLFTLLFIGLFISWAVSLFEGVVAAITVVMVFQSLILGMSGNAGTQSLAVTIRVISDEDLHGKEMWKFIWKETRIGLTNGIIVGLISSVFITVYIFITQSQYDLPKSFAIALCVSGALAVSMGISTFVGTVIPIFFKSIKQDPAVASGPLITTVNDLFGVCIYYSLAWLFLIKILHLAAQAAP